MKNLKSVSDSDLLKQIRIDAENERRSGILVIHQLREIARRRLDAKLGYSSLHRYCMEELKYSAGSAWRRIKAMEALEELPELEAQLEQGALTLANVSQVQHFCEQNSKSLEEKKEILKAVSGLSERETEKRLAQIAPLPERPEKVRTLNGESSELRVTLSAETLQDLEKLRDLMSHTGATYADVISYLAKLGLKKLDPAAQSETRKPAPPGESIPTATRRLVWKRDHGRCGYRDAQTERTCGATRLLQLDHILPRAKGGGNEAENLRLRCRRHNLLAAVGAFGRETMGIYLRK